MGWVIGLVTLTLGVALIIVGARGTQAQTFGAVTGRGADAPTADAVIASGGLFGDLGQMIGKPS